MTIDSSTLQSELQALGVRSGDLLMLHVSLRGLGLARSQGVENGAERLLDAIEAVVGPDGTLLMVLGTEYPFDWVNYHPVAERTALLAGAPPFDYLHAPVLPEVGYFAEAFRQRTGTMVSNNPSGRFGARGARAAALVDGQPWNDYYGPGSPLERLCEWGGRVLRLQASLDTTTVLHYAEYRADVPDKRRTRWDYVIAGTEGPRHVWIECLDDLHGIADWSGDDYFAEILRSYLPLGRHRSGAVGAGEGQLIDAADLVEFGARWMATHLQPSPAPVRIETARLVLTRPTRDDVADVFARYARDPEVTRFLGWPRHTALQDTEAFLAFSDAEWARWPAGPYVIRRREDGRLIGGTGLAFEAPDHATTGYVLAADAWGQGFATEALSAMVALARDLGVRRLDAVCHADHRASWRVLEKCGFMHHVDTEAVFPNLAHGQQPARRYRLSLDSLGRF